MENAPIALFVYNRLPHFKKTIDSLRQNLLAAESELFIFSDGPRTSVDQAKVSAVREYAANIDGFRRVSIVERSGNLGLARSIIDGVTQLTKSHGRVIVLEDDMVTSRYFIQYMNDALDLYADNPEVASIHGYVYPVDEALPETFFLRGADCWGWATWARAWALFSEDGAQLLQELLRRGLVDEFDYFGKAKYTRMLENQIQGKNDSWAVRWYASVFLLGKLTLYPGRSLVRNIGSDSTGENCRSTDVFDVGDVADVKVVLERQALVENREAKQTFGVFFDQLKWRKLQTKGRNWRVKGRLILERGIRGLRKLLGLAAASSNYVIINGAPPLIGSSGWENVAVAKRQHESFLRLIHRMQAGHSREDFVALAQAVDETGLHSMKLLEIGCGSGWNIEVLRLLSKSSIKYTGLDCSETMLALASGDFPGGEFVQGDAQKVPFPDCSFDVVVSGTVLMHLADYHGAIVETIRLSRKWCIFHTVPIVIKRATTFLIKKAYGGDTIEIVFNENELLCLFASCGLKVVRTIDSIDYDLIKVLGEHSKTRTFVCSKNL